MKTEPLIRHVSDTAFFVAHFRAQEGERPDALFKDPLAGRLSGEHGRKIAGQIGPSIAGGWSVAIRTVIIDRFLEEAIAEGADLILNLGAGLDTRPYRMNLPAILRWVEVDFAEVIDFKEERLSGETPRCRLERVRLDLGDAESRRRFFARIASEASRVVVLTEGVTPYLSNAHVADLARDLRAMPSFRYWILDYFSPEAMKYRIKSGMARHLANAPFLFEPGADWFGFFSSLGWKLKQARYTFEEGMRLKRMPPASPLRRAFMALRILLMSREKRARAGKFMGFVVLEPK